jgi:hypothetical protein
LPFAFNLAGSRCFSSPIDPAAALASWRTAAARRALACLVTAAAFFLSAWAFFACYYAFFSAISACRISVVSFNRYLVSVDSCFLVLFILERVLATNLALVFSKIVISALRA